MRSVRCRPPLSPIPVPCVHVCKYVRGSAVARNYLLFRVLGWWYWLLLGHLSLCLCQLLPYLRNNRPKLLNLLRLHNDRLVQVTMIRVRDAGYVIPEITRRQSHTLSLHWPFCASAANCSVHRLSCSFTSTSSLSCRAGELHLKRASLFFRSVSDSEA